jgi:mRNA-degrading endonuclease toxin of MazEF toxin-antitoxin module
LRRESFVHLDNVQTVSKARAVKYIGALDAATMQTIGRTLILALELENCL